MECLDEPQRLDQLRATIARKPALRSFYFDAYSRYAQCVARSQDGGLILELGSGGGFVRDVIPRIVTSDVIPYAGVDILVDATHLPFAANSLSFIGMLNVFHHIPDVESFLSEAVRCLRPGGRMLIVDQNRGFLSTPILRYLHHEPFDDRTTEWRFVSSGPLSGANGALAWMVFVRDRNRLRERWPELELVAFRPHTPLKYWLTGGLKAWCALPSMGTPIVDALDNALTLISPKLGSFVDVEILRL